MISLIPYVRETFRRHLSQKQAVMLVEFDKLKRVRIALAIPFHSALLASFVHSNVCV
jgi:vacuolar protein sorting-associated protein 54